jgi:hypothetical protein
VTKKNRSKDTGDAAAPVDEADQEVENLLLPPRQRHRLTSIP